MESNDLSIMTVNFNTPFFIHSLNKSIRKWAKWFNGKLIVLDNSTKVEKLPNIDTEELSIKHIDNSIYECIDKLPKSKYKVAGNYNSARHCITIDFGIKNFVNTKYLMLLDSDILFKTDFFKYFNKFRESDASLMGYKRTTYKIPCIAPWCCFINVEKMKSNNISFFDFNRILYVNDNLTHDTGASLYEDFVNIGEKVLELEDNLYYKHFKGGSVEIEKCKKWLIDNSELWN